MMTTRLVFAITAICGAAALYLAVFALFGPPDTASGDQHAASPNSRTQLPSSAMIGKVSDKFPNILLRTHDNKPVRFYDDLVKDRTVIVNFMFTDCADDCSLTAANLDRLYDHLGPRMGDDILMLSITLSGAIDTPRALREYAGHFGGLRPGWLYLTGDYDEIDRLRRALGVYDLDPVIDAQKDSHAGILTFGNDRTNRWAALPAMMDSRQIAKTVLRITGSGKGQRL